MGLIADNVLKYYDAEEAWELYDHVNIAVQNAWYRGLIDKETMQKTIAKFTTAAVALELKERDQQNLYGYTYRPL